MNCARPGGIVVAAALIGLAAKAHGQTSPADASSAPTNAPPAGLGGDWGFSATVSTYIIPDDHDYAQPTITADHGRLHLEARYNYEALRTGSIWAGGNFSGGTKLEWEFTPMLGGVFGDTTGIAPGYSGTLSWWKLSFYSEGEYVIVTGGGSGSFFYNWSELSYAPVDWFRFGMVTQRTRAYETERDIQRGFLVGFTYKAMNLTTYVFNPGASRPTVVVAVGMHF